jgi:hypothetical protein
MKLRIHRNSLRFRLNPGDVQKLDESGEMTESTLFGVGGAFIYSLQSVVGIDKMNALLTARGIVVKVPQMLVRNWRKSEQVGLETKQPLENGKELHILIEKDFECLDVPHDECGEALYPNPRKPG